jgi:hypothetical protein
VTTPASVLPARVCLLGWAYCWECTSAATGLQLVGVYKQDGTEGKMGAPERPCMCPCSYGSTATPVWLAVVWCSLATAATHLAVPASQAGASSTMCRAVLVLYHKSCMGPPAYIKPVWLCPYSQ